MTEWPSFLDSYEAAIHNSSELSDVQKFTYLRRHLTDAALKSVSSLTLTNENYGKALTILKERYGSKQAIVNAYGKISKFTSCIVRCKHNRFTETL